MSHATDELPRPRPLLVRFGVFELDLAACELRRRGARLKLQGKPLQLLLALVERPGEIVTRQELQQRLWPEDVFVDFEAGLNTAANRLRTVLGDTASNPRFVETLPRVGYRFVAPVHRADSEDAASSSVTQRRSRSSARLGRTGAWMAATLLLVALAIGLTTYRATSPQLEFRAVTFSRGQVWGARFAADGRTILYSANWDRQPITLFMAGPEGPHARPLGFEGARLVAVSRRGELALLSTDGTLPLAGATLLRAPIGGQPVVAENHVMAADWLADGSGFALARAIDGTNRLEYPSGRVVHRTPGWISGVRMASDGEHVAFVEHPVRHDSAGTLKVADRDGTIRALSSGWAEIGGLAWHPSGEIWFTAARDADPKSLWAATLEGRIRAISSSAGALTLRDIAADGRVIASRDTTRLEMMARHGDEPPRDITLFDWSRVADISSDGARVLFDESGAAGGAEFLMYTRNLSNGDVTRVGDGVAMAFTPDGQSVLSGIASDRTRLRLHSLQGHPIRELPATGLAYQWARFFPDGRTLLALASDGEGPLRVYVVPAEGSPVPVTEPTVVRNAAISPDGTRIATLSAQNRLIIHRAQRDAAAQTVPGGANLAPLLWDDEETLYVQQLGAYTQIPTRIGRLNLITGSFTPLTEVAPIDEVGVNAITKVMLSRNRRTLVYNARRVLSELFVAHTTPR